MYIGVYSGSRRLLGRGHHKSMQKFITANEKSPFHENFTSEVSLDKNIIVACASDLEHVQSLI